MGPARTAGSQKLAGRRAICLTRASDHRYCPRMITSLATEVATTTSTAVGPSVYVSGLVGYLLAAFALVGIFRKADEPVWQAFVPIWNSLVLIKVAGKPMWWFILLLIPVVGLIFGIIILHSLSTSFGHGVGFTIGLIFLSIIFLYILGYDSKQYVGAAGGEPVRGYATA